MGFSRLRRHRLVEGGMSVGPIERNERNHCYDNREFDMNDVIGISRGTTKQDELFDYVDAPDYYKERVRTYDEDE